MDYRSEEESDISEYVIVDCFEKPYEQLKDELDVKIENLEDMESMMQTLFVNERQSNAELQAARKVLIKVLNKKRIGPNTIIGTKRMGQLDLKVFMNACMKIYPEEEAGLKGVELCSSWQENVKNSDWHPFKVVRVDDTYVCVIDEEDEKLANLKQEWGDEIYSAVETALKEVNEYNPCVSNAWELWNYKENRKATLKEVITYIVKHKKQPKRERGV